MLRFEVFLVFCELVKRIEEMSASIVDFDELSQIQRSFIDIISSQS